MAKTKRKLLIGAAIFASFGVGAQAADFNPIVIDAPEPMPIYDHAPASAGGWYIRGDIGYVFSDLEGAHYFQGSNALVNHFDTAEQDNTWLIGAGIGYNISKHLRADLTFDYLLESDFHGSTSGTIPAPAYTTVDTSSMSALIIMANAYVDLGTYHGFTPYVGAGIGGAHVSWNELSNTIPAGHPAAGTTVHSGADSWRFAYSLTAGASYCVTDAIELDGSYKYTRIEGGDMFGYVANGGPGYDKGFNLHQIKAGARYSFGGNNHRCKSEVSYIPPYQPPVYK